ncbi:MAG: ATP-binding protein [Planctomycetota bacterium]|nr:ATP-binding protein [Planctomycetota bacterium]
MIGQITRRLAGDRILLGMLAIQALAGIPYVFPALLPEAAHDPFSDTFTDVILASVTMVAFLTCCRMRTGHREHRWFRVALLLGVMTWSFAELWMGLVSEDFLVSLFGDALSDGILLLGMMFLLIAAEMQPDQPANWTANNTPFRMRLIGVIFSVSALYTYFTLAPFLSGLPDHDNWGRSLLLFIPFDAFLMLRFGWLSAFTPSTSWRATYGLLALVVLSMLAADVIEMMAQEGWIAWIGLEPLGLIWFVPYMGLTVAARRIATQGSPDSSPSDSASSGRELATAEVVIIGLTLAIVAIHFAAPLTGILSPDLASVRNRIALISLSLLGSLALVQAAVLGQRNRRLIRDLENINAQLLQSQKMEAVGRLAGGMAHDFNNILTVVMGNEELLSESVKHNPEAREQVRAIGDACGRASALTKQLLAFSRNHIQTADPLNLNSVITDLAEMLRRLIGERVNLRLEQDHRSLWISANRTQMEQLLMNLCVNARDAMPQGGDLTIGTEIVDLPEEDAQRFGSHAGSHAALRVSDTGCGMSKEILEHAFEPFFSTKDRPIGTGLGLSTVYAIVENSAGEVSVTSSPGKGTTFLVILPLITPPAKQKKKPQPTAQPTRGKGTILLVEDNDEVRGITRRALQKHGYEVLDADSGDAAIHLTRNYGSEINLLLTDVVMPGMSGPEVVKQALQLRPDMRVLYMSGHTGDALVDRGITEFDAGFIQKPFNSRQIVLRIQAMLSGLPN